jgi:pyruvate kinase
MAVKGDDDTVTYSFVNLETLVDIYTGAETDSVVVSVSEDNIISANVKVSEAEGNLIEVKEDGLYVTVEPTDISGKADKLIEEIVKENQILVDDGAGNLEASGVTIEELKATVTEEIMANFDMETDVDAEINSWFE